MSVSLDDLWDSCKACDGSGIHDPGRVRGGAVSITPPWCNECAGRGGKPTPGGQAVLDFLKRATPPAPWRDGEAAMSSLGRTRALSVNRSGAAAGSALLGSCTNNQGLRLQVLQEQPRGHDGPLRGRFVVLDAGDNMHSQALRELAGRVTDAGEVLRAIRRLHPGCVSVANANILALEPS
jgi:hypothetical protein